MREVVEQAHRCCALLSMAIAASAATGAHAGVWEEVEHGYASNGDVRIHYATLGEGPLVIMIHGFPDFWYTWRDQMAGLADDFQVVAIDQRVRHFGVDKATIVGHDWGGAVAWNVAFTRPEIVDKLVILNLPHPNGIARVAALNPDARANTHYAQVFREGSASDSDILFGGPMTAETLAGWIRDPTVRARYVEAFERSDFDAMLAYYKQNYPPPPEPGQVPAALAPPLDKQVLIFHGLEDTALHSDGLNNTWDWIEQDLTIVTVPGAGHFVQQDAPGLVTSTMRWWLLARQQPAAASGAQ